MALLELDRVCRRFGSRAVLDDVSLVLEPGEIVAVWGERRSGRSTLIRVAAGAEPPDSGVVRLDGEQLPYRQHGAILGYGIGYVRRSFAASSGSTVLEQLVTGQLARRVPRDIALDVAWRKLMLVGAESCASEHPDDLSASETIRVALARVLTAEPRLLVLDEPTIGVELLERDAILALLGEMASAGMAVLMTAAQGTEVLGADRVLALSKGRLHGENVPSVAAVTELPLRRAAS